MALYALHVRDLARFIEQYQITGDADEFIANKVLIWPKSRPAGLLPRVRLAVYRAAKPPVDV